MDKQLTEAALNLLSKRELIFIITKLLGQTHAKKRTDT
jgi:hypothetical protein